MQGETKSTHDGNTGRFEFKNFFAIARDARGLDHDLATKQGCQSAIIGPQNLSSRTLHEGVIYEDHLAVKRLQTRECCLTLDPQSEDADSSAAEVSPAE
jgi:hypothetical protein